MYGKEILLEEESFLDTVQELIKVYKENSKTNNIITTILTKEGMVDIIKNLGESLWIDEELIQDQINKL